MQSRKNMDLLEMISNELEEEEEVQEDEDEDTFPDAKARWQCICDIIKPQWVARLLGITLNGLSEADAKEMLHEKKVWPYYFVKPDQLENLDRYPSELMESKP